MSNYPLGVSVQEGVSSGLSPFTDTSKYNIGLLFERERGVANKAIPISTIQEDRTIFGGLSSTKFGAYIVRHIFKNAQNYGAVVYGVRILNLGDSSSASGIFTDGDETTIFTVVAGQQGLEDMGTWANGMIVKGYPKNHANGMVDEYLLTITYQGTLVESWNAPTWAELIAKVNAVSGYVLLVPVNLTANITDIQTVTLAGGTYAAPQEEDYYAVSDELNPTGLGCFDAVDIQMLACAELTTLTWAQEGKTYANAHANKPMFIYNLPYQSGTSVVTTFATGMQTAASDCSAGYNFWVQTSDENGGTIWTPSIGVILGAGFVRVPGINRDFIHYPPASVESVFVDVVDITPNQMTNAVATQWVKRYSTNVAVFKKGIGFFLFSSRTNSTNFLFQSIHIRRVTSFYVKQLESNLLWSVQKPLTAELRRQIYTSIYTYFYAEYGNGALETTIPFDAACQIVVTTDNVDRKSLVVTIDIILTECTESVRIQLNRNDNSLIGKIV